VASSDQWPFDRSLHSQKLNGPTYRYFVAIAISDGSIVGAFGPHKAGANPDLKILIEEEE
jgi:hypothetical protein